MKTLSTHSTLGYRLALGGILLFAAFLHFMNLSAIGYGNLYYTAAVESMLQSWNNWFFIAAEPGGSVTVDKPPMGLWLQTLSAAMFGVSGFSVVLPQIIAGLLSVLLVSHLVKRTYGALAGLVAALVFTVTPIVIATDRNNTMDSTLVFVLLLAAWAFIKATETRQLRYVLLGATLVGIGFEIKMLQAYLVVPTLYALYLFGAKLGFWRKVLHLAAASVVLVGVSLAWAIAVDLTPSSERPYIGSSTNNTVLELMLGHNGLNRVFGGGGPQNDGSAQAPQNPANDDGRMPPPRQGQPPQGRPGIGDGQPPPAGIGNDEGQPPQGQPGIGDGQPPPAGAGLGNEVGQAGIVRLFTAPLNNEASWLLPFGLLSIGVGASRTRLRWTLEPEHQGIILWGGWLLTTVVFFSAAQFFHAYYLIMLAPALAALVGIGVATLWRWMQQRSWVAVGILAVGGGITLAFQYATAVHYINTAWWLSIPIGLAIGGGVLLIINQWKPIRGLLVGGFALVLAGMLTIPAVWSVYTTFDSNTNVALPHAYEGGAIRQSSGTGLRTNQQLIDYLTPRTADATYLMAVPSSMQGASYVIATGRAVLYTGGFNGQDAVVTSEDLAQLVAEGELRYVYWNTNQSNGPNGGRTEISAWVRSSCVTVDAIGGGNEMSDRGEMTMQLYDCGTR